MNRTLRFARTASHLALFAAALGTGLVACDTSGDHGTYVGYDTGIDPASCPGGAPKLVNGNPATWTVIHYAAADNNLEDVIVGDIDEMELGHRGSDNVNVIVHLDRESEDGAWRYEVGQDSEEGLASPVVWSTEDELDTGDWRTLRDFGQWAVTCYPAENYIVVIGGHGGGWSSSDHNRSTSLRSRAAHHRAKRQGEALRVIAPDDSHHSEMYVDELARALDEIKDATERPGDPSYQNRLVAYGSDACLMGTIEVAYDLRNGPTYLIGSEETEPGAGWPYNTVIRELTSRPSYYAQRPHKLADVIIDKFGTSYGPGGSAPNDTYITLAAVDTSQMTKAKNRVDKIAGLFLGLMEVEPQLSSHIASARAQSFTFGDDYTDLGKFLVTLRQGLVADGLMPESGQTWHGDERWRDLRKVIDELMTDVWPEFVISSVSGRYEGARGLSIFFPTDSCGYGLDAETYAEGPFAQVTQWGRFISRYVEAGGSDFEEAYGYGSVTYGIGDNEIEAWTSCEIYDGHLSVYVEEMDDCTGDDAFCDDWMDVSFDIDVNAQKVTDAYIYGGPVDGEADLQGLDLAVTDAAWDTSSNPYFEGSFKLDLGDGRTVDVSFACEEFEVYGCYDDDW